jgi:hypothetical protein
LTELLYQAKAGDGFTKRGIRRTNSFFSTPKDAVSEALALKEKMDSKYKNEIQWDYQTKLSGKSNKLNILRGYLKGNKDSSPFYLQIVSIEDQEVNASSPFKPKSYTTKDKDFESRVIKYLSI